MRLQLSNEAYSIISPMERAQLICAANLDKWIESLAVDKASRKGGGGGEKF